MFSCQFHPYQSSFLFFPADAGSEEPELVYVCDQLSVACPITKLLAQEWSFHDAAFKCSVLTHPCGPDITDQAVEMMVRYSKHSVQLINYFVTNYNTCSDIEEIYSHHNTPNMLSDTFIQSELEATQTIQDLKLRVQKGH